MRKSPAWPPTDGTCQQPGFSISRATCHSLLRQRAQFDVHYGQGSPDYYLDPRNWGLNPILPAIQEVCRAANQLSSRI